MRITFNDKQINKLSDLFMDLSKGFYLGFVTLPILTGYDLLVLSNFLISGTIAVYISLWLMENRRRL